MMTGSIRLFVPAALAPGASVTASAAQAHYLATVMRRAAGDRLLLFNGRDGEFAARIAMLKRDRATFEVERQTRAQRPEPDLWLVFALLKRDATDLVAQKATELGAARLIPVFTGRTNASRVNLARLAAIATEAAEQSERVTVPEIAAPRPLAAVLADWPAARPLYAALAREAGPAIRPVHGPSAFLVGPEGGFSAAEVELMRRTPFLHGVHLGPRILRAETAAIVGLALLQAGSGG